MTGAGPERDGSGTGAGPERAIHKTLANGRSPAYDTGEAWLCAQFDLGVMYSRGEGVPEDDAEAVRWYRLAAEQWDALAQTNLGFMYATGNGVSEDLRLGLYVVRSVGSPRK